jgi:hypothetical protein
MAEKSGQISTQNLPICLPRWLSELPTQQAHSRQARPGSGADPQPSRQPSRAGSAKYRSASRVGSAPSRAAHASPAPGALTLIVHRPRHKLRPGTPGTGISERTPLHGLQDFTIDPRLRLPPKVPPDHAHRVPAPALVCLSADRAKPDLFHAFAYHKRGHRMTFEKAL